MELMLFFVKAGFLIGLCVYSVFAFVVVRQVSLMTKTLEVGLETAIQIGAWVHLGLALGTLLLAAVIL